MLFLTLLTLLETALLLFVYVTFQKAYKLWSKQNVPNIQPQFPMGNLNFSIMEENFGDVIQKIYNKFKESNKTDGYGGLFFLNKPVLLVLTPAFARIVLATDFQYFTNRGVYFDKVGDPLSANLFFIENNDWKQLRGRMTPAFTLNKIKNMFTPLRCIGDELVIYLQSVVYANSLYGGTEITEFLFRFNTDVIGSCAFGLECNTLNESNSEFREIGRKMLQFNRVKLFSLYVAMLFRRQAQFLGYRLIDKDVSEFIQNVVKNTIAFRKANNVHRNDFLQLMIDLLGDDVDQMSVDDIAANVFVFFFAGFETSSTTMTYALYELAQNLDVQDKVRHEIHSICKKNGQITYDGLTEMTYLDQVINVLCMFGRIQRSLHLPMSIDEILSAVTGPLFDHDKIQPWLFISINDTGSKNQQTMRKHPAVGTLHRVCNSDYTLPTGAVIPKGTYIIIPALAFHRDENLFKNPMKFDPDRFSVTNRNSIDKFSFLPFGEGPRACIGLKFGLMQTKLGLAMMLNKYKFTTCAKTKIPLEIDNVSLLHVPKGGVWLEINEV